MKYILIILFSFLINSVKSQDYFEQYQQLADSFEVVYGIPSSVIMGVAYHESGGGKSQLARYSNNHFGIKGYNPKYRSSFRYFNDYPFFIQYSFIIFVKNIIIEDEKNNFTY